MQAGTAPGRCSRALNYAHHKIVRESLGDAAPVRKPLLIGLVAATVAAASVASAVYVYTTQIEIDGVSHMLSTWRSQAEAGDRVAQYVVGAYYLRGGDGSEDIPAGLSWLRKAANQREPRAELQLGLAYRTGAGVEANDVESVRWLRFATEQGNAEAAYNLGYIYDTGLRVSPRDPAWSQVTANVPLPKEPDAGEERKVKVRNRVEAARLYRFAADHGHTGAMLNLGNIYRDGRGVDKDGAEAVRLYRRVADTATTSKDPLPGIAAVYLAMLYHDGGVVPKDDAATAEWLSRALAVPSLPPLLELTAADMLSKQYAEGRGVPRDDARARALYEQASAAGLKYRRAQTPKS